MGPTLSWVRVSLLLTLLATLCTLSFKVEATLGYYLFSWLPWASGYLLLRTTSPCVLRGLHPPPGVLRGVSRVKGLNVSAPLGHVLSLAPPPLALGPLLGHLSPPWSPHNSLGSLGGGMLLFILSEVFFFSGYGVAYLDSALHPDVGVGSTWLPLSLLPLPS